MKERRALPVYLISNFPDIGHSRSTDWTTVCNKERFVYIMHLPFRDTSRWVSVDRKRPYGVFYNRPKSIGSDAISWHKTLEAAERTAKKYALEFADLEK